MQGFALRGVCRRTRPRGGRIGADYRLAVGAAVQPDGSLLVVIAGARQEILEIFARGADEADPDKIVRRPRRRRGAVRVVDLPDRPILQRDIPATELDAAHIL